MLKALLGREKTDRDKRTLYVAYYDRQPTEAFPVPFQSALLVVPKYAEAMGDVRNCTRFEVVNQILPHSSRTGVGVEVWAYHRANCLPRTFRLAGLQKLGKLPNKYNDDVLEALFLPILPQPLPIEKMPAGWECRDWVISALQSLADDDFIDLTDKTASEICQSGINKLMERKKTVNLFDQTLPVFTMNMDGDEIISQIGYAKTWSMGVGTLDAR